MTNLEGRVIQRQAARSPPPNVWTDVRILAALADRLGGAGAFLTDPDHLAAEFRRATAGGVADHAGMSPDRLASEQGLFWPCPDEAHPGTPRLFLDRFGHPDGRARFTAVTGPATAEAPDDAYPLHLATSQAPPRNQGGATLREPHRASNDAEPDALVEIHPDTAASLGLRSGAAARITTRRGSAVFAARLTADIRRDTLFVPFHGGLLVPFQGDGASDAGRLTLDHVDPVSHTPELKVCAARIEAAPATA